MKLKRIQTTMHETCRAPDAFRCFPQSIWSRKGQGSTKHRGTLLYLRHKQCTARSSRFNIASKVATVVQPSSYLTISSTTALVAADSTTLLTLVKRRKYPPYVTRRTGDRQCSTVDTRTLGQNVHTRSYRSCLQVYNVFGNTSLIQCWSTTTTILDSRWK